MVEHNLAKVGVAGSSPVVRSIWAFSSGGERFPDTEEVRSSNLLTPTKCSQSRGYVSGLFFWKRSLYMSRAFGFGCNPSSFIPCWGRALGVFVRCSFVNRIISGFWLQCIGLFFICLRVLLRFGFLPGMAARIHSFVWFGPGFTASLGIAHQINGELTLVACRGTRILYSDWFR